MINFQGNYSPQNNDFIVFVRKSAKSVKESSEVQLNA